MKKQFDPNLSSNNTEDILFGELKENKSTFSITEKDENTSDIVESILSGDEAAASSSEHHHSSHHHHSSGSHHHHSHSGSSHHHSSSSGHHHSHSSGSHHSSSSHHHHSSHHSSHHKKKKMKTGVKVLIVLLLIIALLAGGTVGAFFIIREKGKEDLQSVATASNHQEIIEYNGKKYQYNSNLINIVFMGIDKREIDLDRKDMIAGCADTDMLISIDVETGKTKVIAVPRDTMVDIDIYTNTGVFLKTLNTQLTLAYSYATDDEQGCENVVNAVSRILYNIPIEKYFALNLEGIKPINDSVGGVTLQALYSIPNYNIYKGQMVTLKGDMAEAYVRTRDMDYATAAQERSKRQVQYVQTFASQLIPAVKNNFGVVTDLYNTASQYSKTNISLNNATYLATILLQKNITSFESYSIEGTTDTSPISANDVNAEFTPDPDKLMETVLEVFYTEIG